MVHFFSRKYFFLLGFLSIVFVALGQPTLALTSTTTTTTMTCAGNIVAGVCIPSNTGLSERPVVIILTTFMFWLLTIVGIIAVIAFVISGIQYLTSVGDPKRADKAKSNMVNSIIGIVVALSGVVILQAIGTLFTASTVVF